MRKKILILGASSDIGISTVEKFLSNGWDVVAHYNKNSKALLKFKSKIDLIKIDFSTLLNESNLKKITKKKLKDIDGIVSLTGYLNLASYHRFKLSEFNKHININYLNTQLIIRYVLKRMIKKKWGRILVSSSIGTKFGGAENSFLYSLSKHMNEFFPTVFKKLANKNIFYNCIQIGLTNTKMNYVNKNKNIKKRTSLVPVRRMANTKEIAEHIYHWHLKRIPISHYKNL